MRALGGTHISAAELAELELPGLPTTKRGVHMRAVDEDWPYIERLGRGGGRLYAIDALPEAARQALQAKRQQLVAANTRSVGRPKGSDFFTRNPDVADAVEAIRTNRELSASAILELLAAAGFTHLPSRRSLSRYIKELEKRQRAVIASFRDPDAYKSRYKIALGRADGGVTYAHEVWQLDGTKYEVMLKEGRCTVLGGVDVFTRRAKLLVTLSESSQSVRRLLTTMISEWGVLPATLVTDNGSGFIAEATKAAYETLDIDWEPCAPGTPESKGHIERLFGTCVRERAELLPGYLGHSVAEAQKIRARAKKETGRALVLPELTMAELQTVLDNWCNGTYLQRRHGTLRMSPLQKLQTSKTPPRRAPSDDVLKIALSARLGTAVVGKRGIQWKNGRYWAASLPAWMGRTVEIRLDEDDLGALFVFDEDGHFIDTAVNHERAGLSQMDFAQAADRDQREYMKRARAEVREKMRNFSFEKARDALLREEAERAGKLVVLPPITVEHGNARLDSIANAPEPQLPSEAELEAAMARTAPARSAPALSVPEKVAAADRILDAHRRGQAVDPDELERARTYATSIEYRAEKLLTGDFGRPGTPNHHDHQRRTSA